MKSLYTSPLNFKDSVHLETKTKPHTQPKKPQQIVKGAKNYQISTKSALINHPHSVVLEGPNSTESSGQTKMSF